ncbi:MAG: hypothetical protein NTZ78_14940 [Candidatus Aureabacteria bacterium]|nr:hypothetical protein [Candidatus Auribacterota bacterium]
MSFIGRTSLFVSILIITSLSLAVDASFLTAADEITQSQVGEKGATYALKIMTMNSSALFTHSDQESIRLCQGLAPDVALLEEWSVSGGDYRAYIDNAFGTSFSFYRDPLASNPQSMANGIASRWTITASGSWQDVELSNRYFTWARIDIPGDTDLQVVAVHLNDANTASDQAKRATEANNLKALVEANFDNNQYILIGGDLNTGDLNEPCLSAFSTYLDYNDHIPVDSNGNSNTNKNRKERYDWLMPNHALDERHTTLSVGGQSYPEGLVFDSHVFTPLSAVPPILIDDTHNSNMDHDPVLKAFELPGATETPTVLPLAGVLNSSTVPVGGALTFGVVAQPPGVQFDAYGGIMSSSGALLYSFSLKNPYALQNGLKPLALKAFISEPASATLYSNPRIPAGVEGTYTFIIGFVPAGMSPSLSTVIHGYLWQGNVTIIN